MSPFESASLVFILFLTRPLSLGILDPISKLRPQQRRELSDSLNKHSHIGNDWRLVAEKLGFDNDTIAKIKTAPDQMSIVLEQMQHRMQTIHMLVEIFNEMGRYDCIEILRKGGIVDISSIHTGKVNFVKA